MSVLAVSEARSHFGDVIERVRLEPEPLYLTKHSRPVVALVEASRFEVLTQAAEDLADIRAAQAARDEMTKGALPIPWDDVKRDLGLA